MTETIVRPLVILDPTVAPIRQVRSRATRLDTLDGKTIGLLDNTKVNSDRLLQMIAEEIAKQYQVAGFVMKRKEGAPHLAAPSLLDELAEQCDAVITGVGD